MSQSFAAVVVTGLAIFGLAFVAAQSDFDFGTGGQPDQVTLFERNFGQIGSSRSDMRTVNFDDFTVGEARGEVLADQEERVSVSRQFLGGETYEFSYRATQPQGGTVSFEVLGKEGYGKVYLDVNGKRVFENALVSDAEEEIKVPASALQHGENTFEIGTTKGGVFSSSRYVFEDFRATVNDRKFHDYVDSFRMYDYELRDFLAANLSFEIRESVMTEPLEIRVNGEQVYSLDRVRGRESVSINPANANFGVGFNSIRFSTEGEAAYTVENPQLMIRYVGRTSEARTVDSFSITGDNLDYVERNDTVEEYSFEYRTLVGSPKPINLTLNGDSRVFTPRIGSNSVRINAESLELENSLQVSGQGAFQLNNFLITSERVEG